MSDARKGWKPTAEQRQQVATLSGYGLTLEQIGGVFGETTATIGTICKKEVASGKTKAIAALAEHVYARAFINDTMAMFWLKTQARWQEVARTEISGPESGPMQITVVIKDKIATTV